MIDLDELEKKREQAACQNPFRTMGELHPAIEEYETALLQAAPKLIAMARQTAQWKKLYLRAVDEANHLTNYVEDGLVLRKAEARLDVIQAEARELSSKEQTL